MRDCNRLCELSEIEILEEPMMYIYIMNTESGKVKIGKTTNIQQRYQSLSGSNSQGNPITAVYCSGPTSLYTIERLMHDKFAEYRLGENTEWFEDENDKTRTKLFNQACNELIKIFEAPNFDKLNELRLQYSKKKTELNLEDLNEEKSDKNDNK
jgi:predicted GIY-YIG superfamily endonuclease